MSADDLEDYFLVDQDPRMKVVEKLNANGSSNPAVAILNCLLKGLGVSDTFITRMTSIEIYSMGNEEEDPDECEEDEEEDPDECKEDEEEDPDECEEDEEEDPEECDIVELNKALKEGKQVDLGHSLFYYQKMKDIEQLMNKWKPAPGFESEFRIILQFVTELSFRTMS